MWNGTTLRDTAWRMILITSIFAIIALIAGCASSPMDDEAAQPSVNQAKKITNSIGMEFVYIAPGKFKMGSPSNQLIHEYDQQQHRVTLTKGFYMQTTEVTQGQWKAVMGSNPSYFKCGDQCPVEWVSWDDVQQFIRKLNQREGNSTYRLPTEAEWEYAARAGTDTHFAFGRCLSTDQANYNGLHPLYSCSKGEYKGRPIPVASLQPNSWGLYDMHGNVREWCQDWYGEYPLTQSIIYFQPGKSATDPIGPSSGLARVARGGNWDNFARECRSAERGHYPSIARTPYVGFRLVRNP